MAIITSASLLVRMQNISDHKSWDQFYRIYSPLILAYCRKRNIADELAHDVLQETMVRLLRIIPKFKYDPKKGKFSALLLTIVHSKIIDAIRRQSRYCTIEPDFNEDWVGKIKDSNISEPCRGWDELWRKNLLLHAIDRVKSEVEPITYQSFKLNVLQKKPIDEVCAILSKKYGTEVHRDSIYQHKTRMIKKLRQIIEKLKKEMGE